ncbi:MAG: DUF6340 family protein [Brumimicrobium sp.]|nr:DUF6340 family protein [Brumimicrobium sp.]
MKYYILFLLVGGLFLQGCKTSFRISVKEPAVVKIPENATRFGVINNVDSENSPEKKIAGVIMGTEQINGNVEAAKRAVDGALRALENSSNLKGQSLPELSEIRDVNGVIEWEKLKEIAKEKELDGFIELTQMESVAPVGGSVLANASGQNNMRLEGTMFVNYYLVDGEQKYERYKVYHVYNIPTSGTNSVVGILNDVRRKREYYEALGFQLGYKSAALIYPNWVWVHRKYYTKGNSVLKRAKPMIQKGNWDIAEEQLTMGLSERSDRIRGRVLYNLALVKEGQGQIDEAIKYAKEASLECGNKLANDYLVILRERKWQMEQLGG